MAKTFLLIASEDKWDNAEAPGIDYDIDGYKDLTDEEAESIFVEDIGVHVHAKLGYGIMELAMIYKIMEDLWKDDEYYFKRVKENVSKNRNLSGGRGSMWVVYNDIQTFNDAKKLYDEWVNKDYLTFF